MDSWLFGGRTYACPIVLAMDRFAGKWKTHILWHVHGGTRRFNALCSALPQVNRGVVLRQLRALERDGLLSRREFHDEAVRHVEYSLTPMAVSLTPAILALAAWGREHGQRRAAGKIANGVEPCSLGGK
jgi:DNA-binding HxlR family transcriptional regulator